MLEPRDYFSAKEHNIRSLLSSEYKKFRVPEYQRNFAWTKEELEPFWSDFKKTIETNFYSDYRVKQKQRPHFFGTILLTESELGEYEITDGQQRLTVSTILLKSLLDISIRLENPQEQSGINSLIYPLLYRNDYDEPLLQRLYLDSSINEFYKNYILLTSSKDQRTEHIRLNPIRKQNPPSSMERLKQAHDFLAEKLDIDFPETIQQYELHEKLKCYIKTFTRLFTVLEIVVKDRETAYTIFGTLNNRGKDLNDSDIIKNEIFKSARIADRLIIKDKWDTIIENIDTEDLTDYLRFQYASVYGPVKKVDLFNAITKLIEQINPISYLDQLKTESEWYSRVSLTSAPFWDENITEKLETFRKYLDISHSLPLLLTAAVLYNDTPINFNRLINATLVFCFRYFTIGKHSVESLEREIGNISKNLRSNQKTLDQAISDMKDLTADQDFIIDFKNYTTKSNSLAFYILYQLEKHYAGGGGVVPLQHSPNQHVEHIMPKKPSRAGRRIHEWCHVRNDPEYKDYVFRLGNLLILERDKNQAVGTKDFNEKKAIYSESGLLLPREIASTYSEWNFDTINGRQEQMAKIAVELWGYY